MNRTNRWQRAFAAMVILLSLLSLLGDAPAALAQPIPPVLTGNPYHTCGLSPEGAADCWGFNTVGQAADQAGPYTQLSAGSYHTCGLTPEGAADCWGDTSYGQAVDQAGPYGSYQPNQAPVAVDDSATTSEGTPVTVSVLANDRDEDGDALTITLVSQPRSGVAALNDDGTVSYTPNAVFSGSDSFTYRVSDGTASSNEATVSITVTPANTAPTIYAVDNRDDGKTQLYTLNPATGVATRLGTTTSLDIEDLAVHPQTGELYATTGGGGKRGYLYRIDRSTGALTEIGPSGFDGVMALTFRASDTTLWGWAEGKGLVQFDLATGKATLVTKNTSKFEGMAWAPSGKLYLAIDKTLYELNLTTGKTTTIARNLPKGTEALDILPNSKLVGGTRDASKITLFSYDLSTKKIVASRAIGGASGFIPRSIEGLSWPASQGLPPGF